MAFDWRELFLLAHALRMDALESKRRTSVGRAYYYVYHIALVEAQKFGYDPKMPSLRGVNGGLHKKLWAWYSYQPDVDKRQLGIDGNRLHSRRIKVDYVNDPPPSFPFVQQQLDETRAFELLLAKITFTSTPPSLP